MNCFNKIWVAALLFTAAIALPSVAMAAVAFVITNHQVVGTYGNNVSVVLEMSVTNTGTAAIDSARIFPAECSVCGVLVNTLAAGQTATYMGDVEVSSSQYNDAGPLLGLNWQVGQ